MSIMGTVKKRVSAVGRSVKKDIKRRAKEYSEERTFRRGVEKEAREITKTTGREAYRKRRLEWAKAEAVRRASQPVLPTEVRVAKAAQRVSKSAYNVGTSMMAAHDEYFGFGGSQQKGKQKRSGLGSIPSTADLLGINAPQPQKKKKKRR